MSQCTKNTECGSTTYQRDNPPYSSYVAYHNFKSTLLRHDRWHQVSSQSIKGSQRVGNMDDERLIVEVQQHEVIYVPNHHFYKENVRKEKAWYLIAIDLGVEGEYIRFRIIA